MGVSPVASLLCWSRRRLLPRLGQLLGRWPSTREVTSMSSFPDQRLLHFTMLPMPPSLPSERRACAEAHGFFSANGCHPSSVWGVLLRPFTSAFHRADRDRHLLRSSAERWQGQAIKVSANEANVSKRTCDCCSFSRSGNCEPSSRRLAQMQSNLPQSPELRRVWVFVVFLSGGVSCRQRKKRQEKKTLKLRVCNSRMERKSRRVWSQH